jgi:hypothetical protein
MIFTSFVGLGRFTDVFDCLGGFAKFVRGVADWSGVVRIHEIGEELATRSKQKSKKERLEYII